MHFFTSLSCVEQAQNCAPPTHTHTQVRFPCDAHTFRLLTSVYVWVCVLVDVDVRLFQTLTHTGFIVSSWRILQDARDKMQDLPPGGHALGALPVRSAVVLLPSGYQM